MDPVFERYKEALKAGHLAVMRGRPREALEHYRAAARLADHRPLPYASIGGVLLRMGRPHEALEAFEQALLRAPDEPSALEGRIEALRAAGRRQEADAEQARLDGQRAPVVEAGTGTDVATGAAPPADAEVVVPPEPDDPEVLLAAGERARDDGDHAAAVAAWVAAADSYSLRGARDAALDACQRALALEPGAPSIHLALARLYAERGWRDRAAERVILLDRLLTLDGRGERPAELVELARDLGRDDPTLAAIAMASDPQEGSGAAGR